MRAFARLTRPEKTIFQSRHSRTWGNGFVCRTLGRDNLDKSLAETAIQNMNQAGDLEKTAGLLNPGVGP